MTNSKNQALPTGTVIAGTVYTYTIEKVLGQGSFGITYLASTSMKGPLGEVTVPVALKEFFAKDLDSRREGGTVSSRTDEGIAYRYARAFQRESENLSKMKHPGIVRVLEAFEANGTYYYSMEYLSGGSLDDKVKGVGMLEAEALPVIKRIGEAVAFMHERKMMHLDLKPKNVMLKGDNEPVVIDFGLSKQYDSEGEPESSSSIGLGTPGYAPIEQANQSSGKAFQSTLDIYALGATLYKMLTGVTPPTASSIIEEGFPEEDLEAKAVSENTISAIREAMRPSRKDRPQTVSAFLSLLDNPSLNSGHVKYNVSDETFVKEIRSVPSQKQKVGGKSKKWLWILLAGIAVCAVIFAVITGGRKHNDNGQFTGMENGHEWVDLGLSVKWATCNVGASSPSDYGSYFAWGETTPKSEYSWSTLVYSADDMGIDFTKYNADTQSDPDESYLHLELMDDAANANWGGGWRMPSKEEFAELEANCTLTWTTQDGISGYRVKSKKNGKSIFLPAAGGMEDDELVSVGAGGRYWSSTLDLSMPHYGKNLAFWKSRPLSSAGFNTVDSSFRYKGFSVRPVLE